MSEKSAIEWTDATWNPTTGCTQVSPGCDRCYAMVLHNQRHAIYVQNAERWTPGGKPMPGQYASPFETMQLFPQRLDLPLHWKQPKRIFVNSMSDLFHKDVPAEFILQVFEVMRRADHHIYQVLTKRPSRAALLAPALLEQLGGAWPWHIWMGTSVESADYRWRVDKLRQVPALVRFISAEPLLGLLRLNLTGIHWVIAGAESGEGAREMDDDWVRAIRDQCQAAHVDFFFKQRAVKGKKISLPELDGRVWSQMPQPPARSEM